jgi:hypothetical protein
MADDARLRLLLMSAWMRTRLTKADTARLAGISLRGLHNILNGVDSNGKVAPGLPFTVARIALVVGVTGEQLRAVGREDAAESWEVLRGEGHDPEVWLCELLDVLGSPEAVMHYLRLVLARVAMQRA